MRQLQRVLAVNVDSPQVLLIIAIRKKHDVSAIGRDSRLFVETGMGGKLFGRATFKIDNPQVLFAGDLRGVDYLSIRRPRETVQSVVAGRGYLLGMIEVAGRRQS